MQQRNDSFNFSTQHDKAMEQTVQKLLQEVQIKVAELEKNKTEFEERMKQDKKEYEKYKNAELKKIHQEAEEALKEREENLSQREGKLQDAENFVRDQQIKNSKKIKLNVGGQKFVTTLTSLTLWKDSMLASMFSGRYTLEKDEDGCYFIDRSGKLFSYILDYLRSGYLSAEVTGGLLEDIEKEATYFQLSNLVGIAQAKLNATNKPNKNTSASDKKKSDYFVWANNPNNHVKANLEISSYVGQGHLPIYTIANDTHHQIVVFKRSDNNKI